MVKKVLLPFAAIGVIAVLGLVIVIAMQPSTFHVERSAMMQAPAAAAFAQANDFHNWDAWSPWLDLDPNAKTTYEGPTSGEGATFRWAGNDNVGEGSMKIVESQPHERIAIELGFIKPYQDTALTHFTFQPHGDETNVTWSMDGRHNFMSKAMCLLLFDMDEMIGSKYEEGLANMKKIVEDQEQAKAAPRELPTSEIEKPGAESTESETNANESTE
jgi:hypothetical protein